jgi:CheY-like chemotaxis protein
LYVTGYLDDTTLRHGLAHQAEGVLAKPFAPAVLVRRVTELLEGRA